LVFAAAAMRRQLSRPMIEQAFCGVKRKRRVRSIASRPASQPDRLSLRIRWRTQQRMMEVPQAHGKARRLAGLPRETIMHARQVVFLSFALTSLLFAGLTGCATPMAPFYTVAVVLPGDIPESMNARGDFVGYNPDRQRGFVYAGGVRTEIGTFGGATSNAAGINDAGEVVGSAGLADGQEHAFLYRRGVLRDLGTLGGAISVARDINNAGTIVGLSLTSDESGHAFVRVHGRMRDLGTLGGDFSDAFALNNRGQVVGYAGLPNGGPSAPYHAVLYDKGRVRDLGTFDGTGNSMAYDINDAGQIVGDANARAFLYTARTGMVELGTLGGATSLARAINNRGQVVGGAETADGIGAFLYTRGRMININTLVDPALGWEFLEAFDINDRGQILAYGCRDFACFAVRLDPAALARRHYVGAVGSRAGPHRAQ
jgi:probable HAF family extracellular repeat protein